MTSCGLNGAPLKTQGQYPAAICCNLTNGKMPHLKNVGKNRYAPNVNHEGDTRFVKDIENCTLIGYRYFDFQGETKVSVRYRGSGGKLSVMTRPESPLDSVALSPSDHWTESDTLTFEANTKLPLYFIYTGKGKIDLLEIIFKER